MKKLVIIFFLVTTTVAQGQIKSEIDKQRFQEALDMIKKGEAYLGQTILNQLISSYPMDEHLYLARAKSNLILHRYDHAMNDYTMAAQLGNRWLELDGRKGILHKNFIQAD